MEEHFSQCFPTKYHEKQVNQSTYRLFMGLPRFFQNFCHYPKRITWRKGGKVPKIAASTINKGVNTKSLNL